jgi:hypothetical protein
METLIFKPKNIEQLNALKIFAKAFNVPFLTANDEQNPSPSEDEWFLEPNNLKQVEAGVADIKAGRTTRIKDAKNIWESIL